MIKNHAKGMFLYSVDGFNLLNTTGKKVTMDCSAGARTIVNVTMASAFAEQTIVSVKMACAFAARSIVNV